MFKALRRSVGHVLGTWWARGSLGAAALAVVGHVNGWAPTWAIWAAAYAALFVLVVQLQARLDQRETPTKFDMSFDAVIARILREEPGSEDITGARLVAIGSAFRAIRQKCAVGELHARAERVKLQHDPLQLPVTREEWEASALNLERWLEGDGIGFANNERGNFWFSSEEIDRIWPPAKRRLVLVPFWRWEARR